MTTEEFIEKYDTDKWFCKEELISLIHYGFSDNRNTKYGSYMTYNGLYVCRSIGGRLFLFIEETQGSKTIFQQPQELESWENPKLNYTLKTK